MSGTNYNTISSSILKIMNSLFGVVYLGFSDRVSLYSPGWPGTHKDQPASPFYALDLMHVPGYEFYLNLLKTKDAQPRNMKTSHILTAKEKIYLKMFLPSSCCGQN